MATGVSDRQHVASLGKHFSGVLACGNQERCIAQSTEDQTAAMTETLHSNLALLQIALRGKNG